MPLQRLDQLAGRRIMDAMIFTSAEEGERFDFLHIGLDAYQFVEVVPFLETDEDGHTLIRLEVSSPIFNEGAG